MLICCPKCHSIYEIPDNLISKTGQNFRCQACANVWHAMQTDALGYTEKENPPYIEAITVSEPPIRNFPANKQDYNIPADTKSGKKTLSSKDILAKEGNKDYTSPSFSQKTAQEIELTSSAGTSFTISTIAEDTEDDNKRRPYLYNPEADELTVNAHDRLLPEPPFKGYTKTYILLFLIACTAILGFFRREIVTLFPKAEPYYNKVYLSGLNNPEYLEFQNISLEELIIDERPMLKITADIYNNSFYTTHVPDVTISDVPTTYSPKVNMLSAHQSTSVEMILPLSANKNTTNLILSFKK